MGDKKLQFTDDHNAVNFAVYAAQFTLHCVQFFLLFCLFEYYLPGDYLLRIVISIVIFRLLSLVDRKYTYSWVFDPLFPHATLVRLFKGSIIDINDLQFQNVPNHCVMKFMSSVNFSLRYFFLYKRGGQNEFERWIYENGTLLNLPNGLIPNYVVNKLEPYRNGRMYRTNIATEIGDYLDEQFRHFNVNVELDIVEVIKDSGCRDQLGFTAYFRSTVFDIFSDTMIYGFMNHIFISYGHLYSNKLIREPDEAYYASYSSSYVREKVNKFDKKRIKAKLSSNFFIGDSVRQNRYRRIFLNILERGFYKGVKFIPDKIVDKFLEYVSMDFAFIQRDCFEEPEVIKKVKPIFDEKTQLNIEICQYGKSYITEEKKIFETYEEIPKASYLEILKEGELLQSMPQDEVELPQMSNYEAYSKAYYDDFTRAFEHNQLVDKRKQLKERYIIKCSKLTPNDKWITTKVKKDGGYVKVEIKNDITMPNHFGILNIEEIEDVFNTNYLNKNYLPEISPLYNLNKNFSKKFKKVFKKCLDQVISSKYEKVCKSSTQKKIKAAISDIISPSSGHVKRHFEKEELWKMNFRSSSINKLVVNNLEPEFYSNYEYTNDIFIFDSDTDFYPEFY